MTGHSVESSSTAFSRACFKWHSPAAVIAYFMMVHALLYGISWPAPAGHQPPVQLLQHWGAMAALVEPHGYELQEHFVTTAGMLNAYLTALLPAWLLLTPTRSCPPSKRPVIHQWC
jgi:hypothetical protein